MTTEITSEKKGLLSGLGLDDYASILTGLLNTGYNMYTNTRDFDYQKALQEKIFEREDTAVKRRVEDLINAGLNPNLAAGSGANAGTIVSRSNTNDVNMGAALDYLMASQKIKQEKANTKIAEVESRMAGERRAALQMENEYNAYMNDFDNGWIKYLKGETDHIPPRLMSYYDMMYENFQNSNELLRKQNSWYNTNQAADLIIGAAGAATGGYTDVMKGRSLMKRMR